MSRLGLRPGMGTLLHLCIRPKYLILADANGVFIEAKPGTYANFFAYNGSGSNHDATLPHKISNETKGMWKEQSPRL